MICHALNAHNIPETTSTIQGQFPAGDQKAGPHMHPLDLVVEEGSCDTRTWEEGADDMRPPDPPPLWDLQRKWEGHRSRQQEHLKKKKKKNIYIYIYRQ